MAKDFARRILPVLDSLLLRSLSTGTRVLDLCCGPGRVTAGLLERGIRADGLDASPAMLSLAHRNAPGAHLLLGDALSFSVRGRYSAVVSTFNSLAHFHSIDDLGRVFRNVCDALVPGGTLVFDLSMRQQYERCWHGQYKFTDENVVCVVRPSYNPQARMARNDISITRRAHGPMLLSRKDALETGNRKMETRSFTILQRCHSQTEIHHALNEAGFDRVEGFDAQQDLGMFDESGRRFFCARRP